MKKADLIKRIEALESLRKEVEQGPEKAHSKDEKATVATFPDAQPTAIPIDDKKSPEQLGPSYRAKWNGRNPMPPRLRGMSSLDITLHFLDGQANREEWDWKNKKKGPPIDFSRYGDLGWML